jgi:hypothetical protein
MKSKYLILLALIISLILVGCSDKAQPQQEPNLESEAYPVESAELSYPITTNVIDPQSGYPISENDVAFSQGPKFTIMTPVSQDDQFVSGTGPAGVPIKLVSVSEVGLVLSETIIENDGTFSFELDGPLVSGHLIGIQLGDITGTDFREEDFLYRDTYYERPFVGILFDMVTVE